MIQQYYCNEKLDAGNSQGVKNICSINYMSMNLTCFKNIKIIVVS